MTHPLKKVALIILLAIQSSAGLAQEAANSPVCPKIGDNQVIMAAIDFYVTAGRQFNDNILKGDCSVFQRTADGGCINPFPYLTREDFERKNPNCCRVLTDIPGDYPVDIRPYIIGEKSPKIYLVNMKFNAVSRNSVGMPRFDPRNVIEAVDCFGRVLHGGFPAWK